MMPVVVSPDALPAVRITAPGRDLVYAGGNPRIAFDARATDDFGLRSLTLRYTIVSGSGEQFEFKDGEIPLAVTQRDARDWRGSASRSLADFNLKEGDMLVYRAVAADARPGDGSASSDAFFVEISRLGVAAGDGFTLPEEETRYALSQQMLIVKTERLHQRRGQMPREELAEAALEPGGRAAHDSRGVRVHARRRGRGRGSGGGAVDRAPGRAAARTAASATCAPRRSR